MRSEMYANLDDNHYKNFPIQPIDIHNKHNLNYTAQAFLKYVTRHRYKGCKRDLEQARDFCIPQTIKECKSGFIQVANAYGLMGGLDEYCEKNGIKEHQKDAILFYFMAVLQDDINDIMDKLQTSKRALDIYIKECYG